jgi:arsenical pump membrane protein
VRYRRPVPGWLRCWGFAAVAAVLANVVDNLPATLVLVLAVLIGVNIGPYLACVGSAVEPVVAQRLRQYGGSASVGEYTRFGLCTVPTALLTAVLALWAGVGQVDGNLATGCQ